MDRITVLFLSRQRLLRELFDRVLREEPDIHLLPPVSDTAAAIRSMLAEHPHVVVVDLNPSLFGLRVASELQNACPNCRILVLSSYPDRIASTQLAFAGAQSFISKNIGIHELLRAVRETAEGKAVFWEDGTCVTRNEPVPAGGFRALTEREAQVLELVAQGFANKQVAAELGISIKTVEKHRQSVMCKLQAHETAGLSWRAFCMGIGHAA